MKVAETIPPKVLEKETETNSAATTSEEKQKNFLNNQVIDFQSYSAREKINLSKITNIKIFWPKNAYKIRAWNFANLFVNVWRA